MALMETTLDGTIQPDGTLVLDGPTDLPAGRVQVVVRTAVTPEGAPDYDEFFKMLAEFEATKIGSGTAARSIAAREAMQAEMEVDLAETALLQAECRRRLMEADSGSGGS
jgi:hypothetical protein